MTFREAIVALGSIPRLHHGRDELGVDCAGYVILVYKLAGHDISMLDFPYGKMDYDIAGTQRRREKTAQLILRRLERMFTRVERPENGDIVVGGGPVNHLGIHIYGLVYSMKERVSVTEIRNGSTFWRLSSINGC